MNREQINKALECEGVDDPEERCPRHPSKCVCWRREVRLAYRDRVLTAAYERGEYPARGGALTMTREQKLEEALKLAAQSAGFQYMTAETRNKIDTALSDAATAPLPHDAIGVVGTLIESLEEGLMTDAGLSGRDRVAMRHQIEALTLAKDEIAALSAPKAEAEEPCPVCAKPFAAGDTCATDIELGKCHAECLADSPTVDLETGEPVDGPIDTFPHVAPKAEAVTVKPLQWWTSDTGDIIADSIAGRYRLGKVTANVNFRLETPSGLIPRPSRDYWPETEAKAAAQADYEARILSAVATSPVPAITDEAVERAAKAIHDGPLGASDEEDFGDNKASDWCREVARAALLAAFPSKGDE